MNTAGALAKKIGSGWRALSNAAVFPAPAQPLVIIHSDDWGRAGIPSPAALERLAAAGLDVGGNPWDHYGLESREDLEALGACLADIRDDQGNPACFTANFVMANADLGRMQAEGFVEFRWRPIADGFPDPWDEQLRDCYMDLVGSGIFHPGLHGFTHFNARVFVDLAAEQGSRGDRVRKLIEEGVVYLASVTPEYNFALIDRRGVRERIENREAQGAWLASGVNLFTELFGRPPSTFCPPGYRGDANTRQLAAREGLRVYQSAGPGMPEWRDSMLILPRNVSFEPLLDERLRVGDAVTAATRAVHAGLPVVVCSHSINYLSRFTRRAESSRTRLAEFLHRLLECFPGMRFTNDTRLVAGLANPADAGMRRPSASEVRFRMRYFL